jgi:hypothetical protein
MSVLSKSYDPDGMCSGSSMPWDEGIVGWDWSDRSAELTAVPVVDYDWNRCWLYSGSLYVAGATGPGAYYVRLSVMDYTGAVSTNEAEAVIYVCDTSLSATDTILPLGGSTTMSLDWMPWSVPEVRLMKAQTSGLTIYDGSTPVVFSNGSYPEERWIPDRGAPSSLTVQGDAPGIYTLWFDVPLAYQSWSELNLTVVGLNMLEVWDYMNS